MSDFNSPSQDDLRAIASARPHLLEQRLEKQRDAAAKKINLKPGERLCAICGEVVKLKTKDKSEYCGVCQGRLNAGETALVTIDLRYMFVCPDKLLDTSMVGGASVGVPVGDQVRHVDVKQIEALKGRVIGVLPRLMDILEVKAKAVQEGNN